MLNWLKKRFIITISAIFLIILLVIMTFLYFAIESTLKGSAKASAYSISNSIYIALNDTIFNSAQLTTFIGNDPYIADNIFDSSTESSEKISSYLNNIKTIYGYDIVRIISFKTNKSYSEKGFEKQMDASNTEDGWFFAMKSNKSTRAYRPLVVNENDHLYFNNLFTIKDSSGNPLGIIMIGLDYTNSLIKTRNSVSQLNASVFVIDSSGKIDSTVLQALNQDSSAMQSKLSNLDIAQITKNQSEDFSYYTESNRFVSFKFIKELDSYLIIVQDLSTQILNTFVFTLVIVVMILSIILLVTIKLLDYSNEKILDEASLDPLTQVYNRSVFNYKLNEALELTCHYNIDSTFIFIDIDDFKKINDEMGHSTGDEIIIRVARLLEECKRNNDILFRWGGDEFGIIVRSNLENTMFLANRILENATQIHWKENTSVSLSIGVTEILGSDTKKHVFDRVDEALYQAKSKGKNQVIAKLV